MLTMAAIGLQYTAWALEDPGKTSMLHPTVHKNFKKKQNDAGMNSMNLFNVRTSNYP